MTDLAYEVAGSGDPVLFIAGTGGAGRTWHIHQVPAFVAAGYRCITFDNRGIGATENTGGFSTVQMLADTKPLMLSEFGIDSQREGETANKYFYQGKVVTDLYFSYKLSKSATIFWGVDNLLNVHPDYGFQQSAKYWAFNNETGGPWDAVQMGFNGMRLFARAAFNF